MSMAQKNLMKKLICVHNGALGDFITVWPSLLALSRWAGTPLYWAGKHSYFPWAKPLGFSLCDGQTLRAVESLYAAAEWPPALADALIVWFTLRRAPAATRHEQLWTVSTMPVSGYCPPREIAAASLAARGAPPAPDWERIWRSLFGHWSGQNSNTILLFPGAGHKAKQWPLIKFFELAKVLQAQGWSPRFVLGPAEVERGLDIQDWPTEKPENFKALSAVLCECRAVCGNDCGPMHLAAAHGAPGVVLFGPTSARQWGPPGLIPVRTSVHCRPCTLTTADIPCQNPACISNISVAMASKALNSVLRAVY